MGGGGCPLSFPILITRIEALPYVYWLDKVGLLVHCCVIGIYLLSMTMHWLAVQCLKKLAKAAA